MLGSKYQSFLYFQVINFLLSTNPSLCSPNGVSTQECGTFFGPVSLSDNTQFYCRNSGSYLYKCEKPTFLPNAENCRPYSNPKNLASPVSQDGDPESVTCLAYETRYPDSAPAYMDCLSNWKSTYRCDPPGKTLMTAQNCLMADGVQVPNTKNLKQHDQAQSKLFIIPKIVEVVQVYEDTTDNKRTVKKFLYQNSTAPSPTVPVTHEHLQLSVAWTELATEEYADMIHNSNSHQSSLMEAKTSKKKP
ncbi:uncharacterized protein MELLADRAFT_109938 [Melampsora larici-populina 98AG31]|uniref:Uncharacterized protein n=1 Tax=Melampsora larici-populina (strain 98AG31 / pathotype 3-4-7) TaxID=747676 RepID=F4RY44_MELLP|nr:uncharacterized protein MELLADRAFT_109938 [Melampsora larici-populina 98AG31]EGG02617.1 hypothetical protein MELLADRAFT_109938 [Melampsora larici-populina 98AG31]